MRDAGCYADWKADGENYDPEFRNPNLSENTLTSAVIDVD
jgi:hypothetical protein